ncbi:glutamate--tRNA ligase [Paenibacillus sp. UNC451MF]|uniref:glutamate--tRNA ligase n=1 Tax=Paenibacillus sp. UNC451MF TaxID=1449063 RepID=UPI00048B1BFA|nr:glutamate--tRNA ligase [Paenibacillus sp. UNC451MF]
MQNKELADLLFPHVHLVPQDIIAKYPARKLEATAKVTRFAPSPTGFLTIGGLYATFISERLAHQSEGVFYLRIEDTDKKREVEGSIDGIVQALDYFGIRYDEGVTSFGEETGQYGPYKQSARVDIYQAFIKHFVEEGLAYPCFCDTEALQHIRNIQQSRGEMTGYYGKWALHRCFTLEQVKEELAKGKPFVIRLKSQGSSERKIRYTDLVKGLIELPENEQDIVIMKADGIPTYHFAHAIDDFLMGTTHVIRGDEWLSSVPIHVQLFEMLGFKRPEYGHLAPIMKMDGHSKRKFSKRKDPDAAVHYYQLEGYPREAISEYFMTLVNSNYEEWRIQHPAELFSSFVIETSKMSVSGPLFDMDKLHDISKDVIAKMSADEMFEQLVKWAHSYHAGLYQKLINHREYAIGILGIGKDAIKPRKDFAKWSDVPPAISYFFDEEFKAEASTFTESLPPATSELLAQQIVQSYLGMYDDEDDKDVWFGKVKQVADQFGFAKDAKTFKKQPEQFKGHVGDVAMVLRLALSNRTHTPDLFDMMQVMGESRVRSRLCYFIDEVPNS